MLLRAAKKKKADVDEGGASEEKPAPKKAATKKKKAKAESEGEAEEAEEKPKRKKAATKKKKAAEGEEAGEEAEEKPKKKKAATKKKTEAEEAGEEAEEKPKKKKAATKKKATEKTTVELEADAKAEAEAVAEEAEEKPAAQTVTTAKLEAAEPQPEPEEEKDAAPFRTGDRVNAWYHRDNQFYDGLVLYQKDEDTYDISWDEPDEGEQITTVNVKRMKLLKKGKKGLPDFETVPLAIGDQVLALHMGDNNFYPGVLTKIDEDDKYIIKWDDPDGCPPLVSLIRGNVKLKLRAPKNC